MRRVGYWLDPAALVSTLSIGERQMVSILQALGTGADLDRDGRADGLARLGRAGTGLRDCPAAVRRRENKAILFVSHFLDEVMSLTDQVTVLRDGKAVLRAETADLDERQHRRSHRRKADRRARAQVGAATTALRTSSGDRPLLECATLPRPAGLIRSLSMLRVARSSASLDCSDRVVANFSMRSTDPTSDATGRVILTATR